MNIGDWVKRKGSFRRVEKDGNEKWVGPRWHLVESIVAGDAVTKCGKRMKDPGLEIRPEMPLTRLIGQPHLCRAGCDRPGLVVFNNEDDGAS